MLKKEHKMIIYIASSILHWNEFSFSLWSIQINWGGSSSTFDFMWGVSLCVWLCMSQRYHHVALLVVPMMLSTSQPPDKKIGSSEQMNGPMHVGWKQNGLSGLAIVLPLLKSENEYCNSGSSLSLRWHIHRLNWVFQQIQ